MSSVRVEQKHVVPADVHADAIPVDREQVHAPALVAEAGRPGVILAAVLVPAAAAGSVDSAGLLEICIVAAVWVAMVRGTCGAFEGLLGAWPAAFIGVCAALAAVVALEHPLPGYRPSALELLMTAGGVVASVATWEWAVRRVGATRLRVLVVGPAETSDLIAQELDGSTDFEIVGRVGDPEPMPEAAVPLAGGLAALAPVVEAQRPDLVVLTDELTYGDALDRLFAHDTGVRVVGLSGFFEYALRRVPVAHLSPAWFMSLVHVRQPIYGRWTKRAFDVLFAVIGLLVAMPIMAVVSLIVSRSRGPLLYRQTRLGEKGRPFTIFKFRTMVPDAESDGTPCFACDDDPRLIPGGATLRAAHLDELPQLWNVLRGEMSIVGPRPERPEVASSLEDEVPFWSRRLLVKPGVTGWAQVSCGYVADCEKMADKLSYDLWYLRNQSVLVDLAICVRTVGQQLGSLLAHRSSAKGAAH